MHLEGSIIRVVFDLSTRVLGRNEEGGEKGLTSSTAHLATMDGGA